MGSNRVRTSMKRDTPLMTQYFWVYDIVESDPHNIAVYFILYSFYLKFKAIYFIAYRVFIVTNNSIITTLI